MRYIQKLALVLGFCIIIPVAALAEPASEEGALGVQPEAAVPPMGSDNGTMPHHMRGNMMPGMNGTMPGHMGMGIPCGGMGMAYSSYSDKAFLSGMIPHHEAAVDMAKAVLQNGKDSYVKGWAQAVIKDQEAEIAQMRKMLAAMGGGDDKAAEGMRQSMHAMMGMSVSSDPDVDFVAMMVPHHAGALHMAAQAILVSNDDKILELAKAIIEKQTGEIITYRQWLAKRKR